MYEREENVIRAFVDKISHTLPKSIYNSLLSFKRLENKVSFYSIDSAYLWRIEKIRAKFYFDHPKSICFKNQLPVETSVGTSWVAMYIV